VKRFLLVFVLSLVFVSPLFAGGTFVYPSEKDPMFSITFPEAWQTDFDASGTLHAYTPNWEVYWLLTVSEGGEKGNAKTEEQMTKYIEEWVKEYTYSEKAIEEKSNDIDFTLWTGSGTDNYKDSKSFGKKVAVDYVEFEPKAGTVGHIISFGLPENITKFKDEVGGIIKSIKRSEKK